MMEKILLNSSKSKESVLVDNHLDIEIKQDVQFLPHSDIVGLVDAYKIYEQERDVCTNYRLIFTINNVCSNVLFNMVTEMVKDEGSDNVIRLTNKEQAKDIVAPNAINSITGITNNIAIKNTEYSNSLNGFKYHCGTDIFNNHVLRSRVFKSVNKPKPNSNTKELEVFNTIRDTLRMMNGDETKVYGLNKTGNINNDGKTAHLYMFDDIRMFAETYNEELREVDGWVGFSNISKIKTFDEYNDTTGITINKTINYENACSFIDMYPDRTLYSFLPKLNNFRNRMEYNWKYDLTYPYKSTTKDSPLIVFNNTSDGEIQIDTALIITESLVTTNINGVKVVFFNCANKHNLTKGSTIKLYYGSDYNTMEYIGNLVTVLGVGDLSGKNDDYYFYVSADSLSNYDLITVVTEDETTYSDILGDNVINYKLRFKKVDNNIESQYYFREFKKIPNFKFNEFEITDDNVNNIDTTKRKEFNNTINKLSFAKNIYGDDIVQIIFTDDVNIKGLIDNLGRPLSEIFLTVIKNNKGWREWYEGGNVNNENIEFSHAFGKVTSGIDLPETSFDNSIHGFHNVKYLTNAISSAIINKSDPLEDDITIEWDAFLGDLVEFSPSTVTETILEDVCHRFNTAQRETNNVEYNKLIFDEFVRDDYDITDGEFEIREYSLERVNGMNINQCPEGYYYKPHIRIPLREYSTTITQNTKERLFVLSCEQILPTKILVTTINGNGLSKGDILYLSNIINNKESDSVQGVIDSVVRVNNGRTLSIIFKEPVTFDINTSIIRIENDLIPSYAIDMKNGSGVFSWREFIKPDSWNATLPEYTFTNNAKYIQQSVNFYLKRQDPHGNCGLISTPISDGQQNYIFPVWGRKTDTTTFEYYIENENTIC